jgi:hypothetical protein
MTDEKQDLDNLTKHPGWLRVVEHASKDIDSRINQAQRNAVGERDDVMALNLLRQCLAARDAIEAFVAWPSARLKVLQAADASRETTTHQMSRRGTL